MKIYDIEDSEFDDNVHFASSFEKCIEFLKLAIDDKNSGINEKSIIRITKVEVDAYFGEVEYIGRKKASEWLKGTYGSSKKSRAAKLN